MKKLILLFTIVCVGQLYGMEAENIGGLPKELQNEIVSTALATSKSVDDAVNMIKKLGILYGVQYSPQAAMNLLITTLPEYFDQAINQVKNLQGTTLEDFTKLVHLLAYVYAVPTMDIAKKFNTLISKKYEKLGNRLLSAVFFSDEEDEIPALVHIPELIRQGADINVSESLWGEPIETPLTRAIDGVERNEVDAAVIKLLLNAGAYAGRPLSLEERKVLEEAMKK